MTLTTRLALSMIALVAITLTAVGWLSYRSLDELRAFYPDVWASQTSKLLIDTLFPKVPSNVLEPLS